MARLRTDQGYNLSGSIEMKLGAIGLVAVTLIGVLLTAFAFVNHATPNVSIETAVSKTRYCNVPVQPVPGSIDYDAKSLTLRFVGKDATGEMPVVFRKGKPNNFEHATSVIVTGQFQDGAFEAREMLVKCPSKYQGQPEKTYK